MIILYPDVSFSLLLKFPFVFLRKKYPMFGLKSRLYHMGKHDHFKKIWKLNCFEEGMY